MPSYIPVKLSQISKELDKLEEMHHQNNQLRASLFNFIVYAQKNRNLPYFVELVEQIAERFPCRIIFIEENIEPSGPYLEASIAAKMISSSDSPAVICDRIYLSTSQNNTQQLLHLILEHTLVDLPIYLLWGKDPTIEHALFSPLQHMAKRLIFHSECSNHLQQLSQKLLTEVIRYEWEVADLNWIYLQEWREMIGAIFNDSKYVKDLIEINQVDIQFCATSSEYFCHNHFQVHYMHGWIAAQLGWEFVAYNDKAEIKEITYRKQDRLIKVIISQQSCGTKASAGTLLFLQFKTQNKKSFTFKTNAGEEMIHIEILDEQKPNSLYNTSFMKKEWQVYLSKEICYNETSLHYKKMLQMLSSINGLV